MRVSALVEFSMPGRLLTTGWVAAAALAVAHAQQQPPAFGTTTRTVAVYATVTDPQRRLTPGLTRYNSEVDDNGGHAKSMKDEMKRAEDHDIMVYAVGLEGLAPMQPRATQAFGGRGIMPQRHNEPLMQKPDEGMAKIAAATGGGYFELTSPGDLIGKFDRVIDELHHQYALGFVPLKLDGKLHDLTVKVNESGYTVRARKRYLAPRG